MTHPASRPRTIAEVQDAAAREAIRAALVTASGNVRRAAETLSISYSTAQREIGRLGLRTWLTEEYERGARQPPKQSRTPAPRKAKPDR